LRTEREGGKPTTRLTRVREVTMQSGDGGEEVAVVALGGGGAQARTWEKESRERCSGGRGALPFIGAGGVRWWGGEVAAVELRQG
jgi:hypothetical protein